MAITKDSFKQTLSCWASGVTVITTRREGGIHGMTATSFCSLSLDPPLIMIAVDNRNRTKKQIEEQGAFGVMILSVDQEEVSNCAAGFKGEEGNYLMDLSSHKEVTGAPILDGSLAWMDCSLHASYDGGDHTIFVGKVEATGGSDGEPLLWFSRGYRQLNK
jgi:3-hydroxy-9,10-secoandrosta-1,3,5(10)-triene-9,17-dione monooxygenase reductase component